jgi:hypothetical protein
LIETVRLIEQIARGARDWTIGGCRSRTSIAADGVSESDPTDTTTNAALNFGLAPDEIVWLSVAIRICPVAAI